MISSNSRLDQDSSAISSFSDGAPRHVALIMDGNRRWAREEGVPVALGHKRGAKALLEIVRAAPSFGIKTLTAYAFSTENWKRSRLEVGALMRLFETYLDLQEKGMVENGIRLHLIGDLDPLPRRTRERFQKAIEATSQGTVLDFVLAINYGARAEICRAVSKMLGAESSLKPEQVTEEKIRSYLDTSCFPDPELLIRTSGEFRLSNFLLWQISYSEVYVTETLWPNFTPEEFAKGIQEYQRRKRRFGK